MRNPFRTFLDCWHERRIKDRAIKQLEAKVKAEKDRQEIERQAYLFWEADGTPEGKYDYYRKLAEDKVKGKNIPILYKLYYLPEKFFFEPVDYWINRQALFSIASQIAILAAIIAFIGGERVTRNNEVFGAWQTITSAEGQGGSGGRIEALEFLNSRPLRFPWILFTETWTGQTEKDWFWNGEKCEERRLFGRRWKRQPLVSLSAPKAYLEEIHLCGADLMSANLREANLQKVNLQRANLLLANLRKASLGWADLQGASLGGANLQQAYLGEVNLQRASLGGANLQQASLLGANLQQASLGWADLQGANLFGANLQEAVLEGANLQQASLWEANLQQAYLEEVNFQEAYLLKANLQRAFLRWANLQEANLQKANLGSANLQEAYLLKANLRETKLVEVKNLTFTQIKLACNWEEAIYKGEYSEEQEDFIAIEPDNIDFIEQLKKDKSSDPEEPVDCSLWGNFD